MIEPGMHINAVGGDCPGKTELHRGVLERAGVFVEYEPQSRIEGELQQMPAGFAVTELWAVLTGQQLGRSSAAQVTVFDSVGFALEDFAALRWLRDAAAELGLGATVDLIPQLRDPKDLYGQLSAPRAALAACRKQTLDARPSPRDGHARAVVARTRARSCWHERGQAGCAAGQYARSWRSAAASRSSAKRGFWAMWRIAWRRVAAASLTRAVR